MILPAPVWLVIAVTAVLCVLVIALVERRRWSPIAKILVIGLTLFVLMNSCVILAVRMLIGGAKW